MNRELSLALLLASSALALGGCAGRERGPKSPDPEYSDQEEYARTRSEGSGSDASGGYYGAGSSGSPEHHPAKPKVGPTAPH